MNDDVKYTFTYHNEHMSPNSDEFRVKLAINQAGCKFTQYGLQYHEMIEIIDWLKLQNVQVDRVRSMCLIARSNHKVFSLFLLKFSNKELTKLHAYGI